MHVGAFGGGVDEEGVPTTRRFWAVIVACITISTMTFTRQHSKPSPIRLSMFGTYF